MAKLRIGMGAMVAAGLLMAAPAHAQRTISQGMSAEQVRSALGAPSTSRSVGEWTYLYYQNGCPVRCGSDDVVFLQNGRVVSAVFRTARRRYAGPPAEDALGATDTSTPASGDDDRLQMPEDGPRDEPGRTITGRPAREPARVGGVRVAAPDDDSRGSMRGGSTTRSEGGATTTRSGTGGTTTIIRRDPSSGSDDSRVGTSRAGSANAREDARNGSGINVSDAEVAADSSQGAPATATDDSKRARENRVEPNTIRTRAPAAADTTAESRRRARERNVSPRVIPRPE